MVKCVNLMPVAAKKFNFLMLGLSVKSFGLYSLVHTSPVRVRIRGRTPA